MKQKFHNILEGRRGFESDTRMYENFTKQSTIFHDSRLATLVSTYFLVLAPGSLQIRSVEMDASTGQSPDWRSTARGLLEKLKYILVHNIMADLTIRLVNNGRIDMEFNVHCFLFVIGSEVFERMLNSTFKEGLSRVIEIKDMEPEIFQIIINYFYGQPVDFESMTNLKKVRDLADVADCYMIHGLKDEIAKYLESLDTPQAACLGLTVAEKLNAPELKDKKLQYIVSHTNKIVKQEEFLSLPEQEISLILEQDILAIEEIDLFKGIEAWIKLNVVKYGKQIIDLLIPKIRYLSMTKEEFTLGPSKSNLIKSEDVIALFSNYIVKDSTAFPSGFSQIKRNGYNNNFELNFKIMLLSNGFDISSLGIEVNKDLIIAGFNIFTLKGNPTESYDEDIKVRAGEGMDENNWPIVGRFKGKINYSSSVFVQLDENLKISKKAIYYVYVKHILGIRDVIDFNKPLNVEDNTCPFTLIKHPNYTSLTTVMSIKLQAFEA